MNSPRVAPDQRDAVIVGTGSAVPARVVTTMELAAWFGGDSAAAESLDLGERRWCGPDESTADLAEDAARQALEIAQVAPEAVDLLIVATETPEFVVPTTSSVVQGRLGLVNAATFDVNAGGAGFVTALDIACRYLRSDARYARVLVVGVQVITPYLDRHDAPTASVFADGAGAVLVEAREMGTAPVGVTATELFTDGRQSHHMGIFAGGTRIPITPLVLEQGLQNKLRLVQPMPAPMLETHWSRLVRALLARIDATADEVDGWFWPQVPRTVYAPVLHALGVSLDRVHDGFAQWGDTGPAGLPMALDEAVRGGVVRDGQLLVGTGVGAGLTMGAVALRWSAGRSAAC